MLLSKTLKKLSDESSTTEETTTEEVKSSELTKEEKDELSEAIKNLESS